MSVIVAFPKLEDAKKIKSVLVKKGIDVCSVSDTASGVIAEANSQDMGIIVTGYKLRDMHYSELFSYLPETFKMVLVGSATRFSDVAPEITCVATPIKLQELIDSIQNLKKELIDSYEVKKVKGKSRSAEDKKLIIKAKEILMKKNDLTEEEAHRFLQKTSMNSGTSAVETAQKIILLYGKEK